MPGRAIQLAEIDERLSYLADVGALLGRIRVDTAARGMGKTSLLREVQRRAERRRILTLWVTAGEEELGLIDGLGQRIQRVTTAWPEATRRGLRDALDSATVTVGVPGVAQVEATVSSDRQRPRGALALEDLLQRTVAGAREHGHTGIVLLIDEIQDADQGGMRTLAYAWQHLQAEADRLPAGVFAAGLPNSPEAIATAVTFSERFAYRSLGLLDEDAAASALAGAARGLGVEWATDGLSSAVDFAAGYPYAVQLIGDATWTAAGRPDAGSRLTLSHVHQAQSAASADLSALFRARWEKATPGEQAFIRAMAGLGDGPVKRGDIALSLGTATTGISVIRGRLIDKGIIEATGYGDLQFTSPRFASYIRDHVGVDRPPG